ncbi:DoxX family membrane protein [bacterium]|nr:MAG: DoxX family membrane protein [bacterium]
MDMDSTQELKDKQLAFAIFRLTMGVNIFLHGFVRIVGGADGFADKTQASFNGTMLPEFAVRSFLLVLPFIEALLGLTQILGIGTRWTLAAGGLLMTTLVLGTAFRSDWNALGTQMIYVIGYFLLLSNTRYNAFSLDAILARRA